MTLHVAASMDHGGIPNATTGPAKMWSNLGCNLYTTGSTRLQNTTPNGRWNAADKYWELSGSTTSWKVSLPGGRFTGNTFWMGFSYYRASGGSTAGDVFGIHRGNSIYVAGTLQSTTWGVFHVGWISGNDFQLYDATDAAIGSTFELVEDTWYWIAVEVDSQSTGTISLKVAGVSILSAEAGDFLGTSTPPTSDLYHLVLDYGKGLAALDDMIFGDGAGSVNNSIPDEVQIEGLIPTGDDSLTGFPSTSYDKVDELGQDDATTETSAGATSDEYTFDTGSLVFSPDTIMACQLVTVAVKDNDGLAVLRPRIDSGGTYYNAANFYVPLQDYKGNAFIWELDPDTASAWTEGGANAVKPSGIII